MSDVGRLVRWLRAGGKVGAGAAPAARCCCGHRYEEHKVCGCLKFKARGRDAVL